jgi:hypothetical protein
VLSSASYSGLVEKVRHSWSVYDLSSFFFLSFEKLSGGPAADGNVMLAGSGIAPPL